ncbi:helix-turn-helix transcriptional regulator [Mesorhizobium sp. NZP2077]|uniref:helix-turn-helix domain-containing protein n=1 Tax=Mesorhizobium sp. NZP2077 TaxID=2483404 RepID=UPI001555FFBE|nr:helix-turn-helix transcriptional regulator [Mesorhizobium sp. NZP2077]QKD16760.1 helix-turn-helix transcriptional regulator [Mesorhizobium sp. NZP2077]
MMFRDWRLERRLGLGEAARLLGIKGKNPGGTLVRIENGSRQPEADMVERILAFTDGAVTAADMHEVRLAWLKDNRPEKFSAALPAPQTEAAA